VWPRIDSQEASRAVNAPAPSSEAAPGRPAEIEEASNLFLIHPISRALVNRLIATPVTPNQVSVSSMVAAALGAGAYFALPWPWNAFAGLACFIVWHVLDGADGDLARRTGRASPRGELIDGICDHISQVILYVTFGFILKRTLGWSAAWWAIGAGVAHFIQANAYETGRKTYRRWVYGAAWMRQTTGADPTTSGWAGRAYIAISDLFSPGEAALEAAMEPVIAAGGAPAEAARARYRGVQAPLVKQSAILSSNTRTVAGFLSMLAGGPIWFFLFTLVVQTFAMVLMLITRARNNRRLAAALSDPAPAQDERA
jgi:phosphatidylglycerophosphate synthase